MRGHVPRPPVTTLSPEDVWAETARHVGLVARIAERYTGRGLDKDDLVQEGVFGLRRAIELYDPELYIYTAFSTYAGKWIKAAMLEAIGNKGHTIKFPRSPRKGQKFNALRKFAASTGSLDEPDAEGVSRRDRLKARPDRIDPELLATALAALDKLEPLNKAFVVAHLGLDGSPPRSLADIAREHGMTREGKRKAWKGTIAKLKRLACAD